MYFLHSMQCNLRVSLKVYLAASYIKYSKACLGTPATRCPQHYHPQTLRGMIDRGCSVELKLSNGFLKRNPLKTLITCYPLPSTLPNPWEHILPVPESAEDSQIELKLSRGCSRNTQPCAAPKTCYPHQLEPNPSKQSFCPGICTRITQ